MEVDDWNGAQWSDVEWSGVERRVRSDWSGPVAVRTLLLARLHSTLHKADTQSGTQHNGTERNGAKWKPSDGTKRSQTEQNGTQWSGEGQRTVY